MNPHDSNRHDLWRLALIAAIALFVPSASLADYTVNAGQPVVVSDDIYKRTAQVGSAGDGPSSSDADKTNQGHGNNEDGVDSSNPGQGGGGPNGAEDSSCDGTGECVDDESKGGGSIMNKKK